MVMPREIRSGNTARAVRTAVAVVLVLSVGMMGRAAHGGDFLDAQEGGVHRPAIDALDGAGVLEGTECGPDRFCPTDPIPRWVVAVWLVRVLDQADPPGTAGSSFADVGDDEWWAPFVERLAALEVTAGCAVDPLRFCPDDPVTRAQMASFLVRAFDLAPGPPASFEDVRSGGAHFATIDSLAAAGITAGCSRDPLRFCPGDPVTRGQMATFLARADGLVPLPATVSYRIGFTRRHLPVDRVYIMGSGGGARQLVSEGTGWDPAWSPDGTSIAYTGQLSPDPGAGRPGATGTDTRRSGSDHAATEPRVFVLDPYYTNDPQDLGAGHSPVWSPDGTRLAFSGSGEGTGEIVIMNLDGAGRRKLADGKDPAWAPDGLLVAFTRDVEGVEGVFMIGVDGTGERYLAEGARPVWSPDGERIAFTRKVADGYDIFVMNADGTEQRQLTDAAGDDLRPAWSPDGDRIAFDTERHGDLMEESPDTEIYVMDADGTDQQRLTVGLGKNRRPVWSSNGRIAFTTQEWRYHYIYSIDADGSDRRRLTYTTDDRDPVWSPDGRTVAFTSDREANYLSFVTEVDGAGQTQVADMGDTGVPAWSPGGARIAFSCCEGLLGYIWVVDTERRGRRLDATAGTDWADDPVWSPDGTRLAFSRSITADNALGFVDEMFLIDADGTNLMQITNTDGGAYGTGRPVWSPDGSQIAFTRFRDLDPRPTVSNIDTELLVVNSDGTGQMIVADTYGDDHNPVWSPDGTRIAFHHGTQSTTKILVVNADGSGQRALARTRGEEWGPRWSPDGSRIVFTGVPRRHGTPIVHVVGADGSDQTNLGFGASPRWSPNGSRIAFIDYGDTGSTWEIVSINPDGTDPTPLTRTGSDPNLAGVSRFAWSEGVCGWRVSTTSPGVSGWGWGVR